MKKSLVFLFIIFACFFLGAGYLRLFLGHLITVSIIAMWMSFIVLILFYMQVCRFSVRKGLELRLGMPNIFTILSVLFTVMMAYKFIMVKPLITLIAFNIPLCLTLLCLLIGVFFNFQRRAE